ncbi:MAG: protein kinase [Planctomycetota bacterium]|jgi:eukaryotic-like serine/threonine-protein kinase|nr:protein kinase [Planctomycetota bacterium]
MSATERSGVLSALLRIDKECDQFETEWQAGQSPRIEDVLSRLPAELHAIAFRELLVIELDLRRRRGDEIRRDEYERRFSSFTAIINESAASFGRGLDLTTQPNPSDTTPSSATTSTRYRDMRLFRRGGLGVLYRATDESLHRETVVKFMSEKCEKDVNLVAQFKVEAEVTSRLDHPGIVPVYGVGNDWNGRPFYVMRMINGRELRQAIGEYHQSPSRDGLFNLLEHLISACNTMAYAHQVGIIHCDIKPANLMIGRYGETFVLDWGLATNFERTSTFLSTNEATVRPHSGSTGSSSGARGGTYGYISPEQLWTDGPIGPTSDVYSLGATLYEILTNQPPFNGHDPDVREKIRQGQFAPPRKIKHGVSSDLEAICLKAMSLSPDARYATAKLLGNDVTNWMRDEAIQAAPDRWFNRVARFARRHRGSTAAFFMTLLTVVIAAGLIYLTKENAAHDREILTQQKAFEEQQKRKADKNFSDQRKGFAFALDAFDGICRPLANDELSNLEMFRPFVDEIRQFIKSYLDDLVNRDSADGMRLHTARVYELRAILARVIEDDTKAALQDLKRAEELFEMSSTKPEERLDCEIRLVQNHLSQGRLYTQLKQYDDARRSLESVIDDTKSLREEQPNNNLILRYIAEAHHALGEVYLNRQLDGPARKHSLDEAEKHFITSQELRELLVKNTTGAESRDSTRDLARSFGYLGDVYLAKGNIPQAIRVFEESKKLRKMLYRERSGNPEYRFQYARGLGNFGLLERNYSGKITFAIEQLEEERKLLKDLKEDFPEVASFGTDLADTQNMLAEIYLIAAIGDPLRADEYRKQASDAANSASLIYGSLDLQGQSSGASGLAQSFVLLSLLDRDRDAGEAIRHAQYAVDRLVSNVPEQLLSGSDLVTLAMARSLLGQSAAAIRSLKSGVERGENAAYRFEIHQKLAFQSIANDQQLAPELTELIHQVRESLTME